MLFQFIEESECLLLREIGFERTYTLVVIHANAAELGMKRGQAHVEILRTLIQFDDLYLPAEECGNDKFGTGCLAGFIEKGKETGVVFVT